MVQSRAATTTVKYYNYCSTKKYSKYYQHKEIALNNNRKTQKIYCD